LFELKQFLNRCAENASPLQTHRRIEEIESSFNGMDRLAADARFRRKVRCRDRPFGFQLR